jgi:hypothetical protein
MCWLHQSAQLWTYPSFLLVPLMILGCIECFAGYRAWRFLLGVNGAVLGFAAGAMLGVTSGTVALVVIGALGGALMGAGLFAGIVPVGSCVFAFASAASLTSLVGHIAGSPVHLMVPIAVAAGLGGALAAILACRPFMIVLAAVAGAQQLASAWCAYYAPYDRAPLTDELTFSEFAGFMTLAAVGMLLQFSTSPAASALAAKQEEMRLPGLSEELLNVADASPVPGECTASIRDIFNEPRPSEDYAPP